MIKKNPLHVENILDQGKVFTCGNIADLFAHYSFFSIFPSCTPENIKKTARFIFRRSKKGTLRRNVFNGFSIILVLWID